MSAGGGRRVTVADRLSYAALRAVLAARGVLPRRAQARLDPWLGRRAVVTFGLRKRAIADNLAHVYPDATDAERRALLAAVAGRTARNLMLLFDNARLIADAETRIDLPSDAILAEIAAARAVGRGIVIVSGHFGPFDAGRIGMRRLGIETGALYRPQNNPLVDRFMVERLSRAGTPLLPRSPEGLKALIRHLRKGGAVAILIDQRMGDGVPLDFLGRPALTSTAAAELAVRQKALVLGGAVVPAGHDRWRIDLEGPIAHRDPWAMTQELNDILAARIRACPEEWHWMHRRWRLGGRHAARSGDGQMMIVPPG